MAYRVENAFGTSSGQTWVTLIAAPNPDEIILVKSLTYDNLDIVGHKYSFALLISAARHVQKTTLTIATLIYDFVDLTGVILLGNENTSLQFRTEELLNTNESVVTAHYARRS